MSTTIPVAAAVDVSRQYPGVRALDAVSLQLFPGQVHALVGENGAGKSTLIKMFGGLEQPTEGELRVNGEAVRLRNPQDSHLAGISVVSQEFRLVPQLSVAENIFLGHELTRGGLIDRRASRKEARRVLSELGLKLSPDRRVGSLTVADQQLVEITRALSREFSVLIMDEPTAALNEAQVETLLTLVERLREHGTAILYVSHRMPEIIRIADVITVLRDGRVVGHLQRGETKETELIELMLGRSVTAMTHAGPAAAEATTERCLAVDGFECAGLVEPVSFDVAPGEVLGIAGLVGSGRSELVRGVFGLLRRRAGTVRISGAELALHSPADAIDAGMFMLSEDRKAEGIVPHLTVLENLVISARGERSRRAGMMIDRKAEVSTYQGMRDRLRIRADRPDRLIGTLSGGNQQKVLFGRAVLSNCQVLLLNEPTRGVDVGAKVEIYELIRQLAGEGVAIVVSSSEAAELAAVSDRCLVLYAGRAAGVLPPSNMTEEAIVAASVGQPIGEVRS